MRDHNRTSDMAVSMYQPVVVRVKLDCRAEIALSQAVSSSGMVDSTRVRLTGGRRIKEQSTSTWIALFVHHTLQLNSYEPFAALR